MIIDEIKKANIEALKNKQTNLRNIYGIIINKYMQSQIEARAVGNTLTDDDTLRLIQKTIKELTEEAGNYKKVGNIEQETKIIEQRKALEKYLPEMLSEGEIKKIILGLEDKSVPNVMKYFKTNYGATVDLKLVNEVLKK